MNELYRLATGPLAWAAFLLFGLGSAWRLAALLRLTWRKERFIFTYMSLRFGLRSIVRWLMPFGTTTWRLHPWLTIVTFAFHACLILTPLFLAAHVALLDEAWNVGWRSLPDWLAALMSLVVLGGCVFFFMRRRVLPEVAYVTSAADYAILAMVAAPFATGLIAYFQWGDPRVFTLLHILSGEVMLAAVPFTRVSHMLYAPLTRAYMGSEFGGVRHARDW